MSDEQGNQHNEVGLRIVAWMTALAGVVLGFYYFTLGITAPSSVLHGSGVAAALFGAGCGWIAAGVLSAYLLSKFATALELLHKVAARG